MTQYENSLIAMKRLLDSVGDTHWGQWITTDIERWRSNGDTSHHLSAYGGMGSFNDFVICRANEHSVTESNEAWANTLFQWLTSVCNFLAKHPTESFTAKMLRRRVGRHDSALAAFVGDDRAPASMREYSNETRVLQGWRCLHCGRSEVTPPGIEYLMAHDLIPQMLFESCEKRELETLVDRALAMDIPGIENARMALSEAATASGILLQNRNGWNWSCPNCKSDDTAVYRWNLVVEGGFSFEPSSDNRSLRK